MSKRKIVTAMDVQKALKELNGSVGNIVKNLKKKRIKGCRRDDTSCPIANYLNKKFNPDKISVGDTRAELRFFGETLADSDIEVYYKLSKPFQEFIKRFDKGEFPELEAE